MKINFTLFGYDFTFEAVPTGAEAKVKRILNEKLKEINALNSKESKKISLIKIVRRSDVSKILIDSGIVPVWEINDIDTPIARVRLGWAKDWVEGHFTRDELTNND